MTDSKILRTLNKSIIIAIIVSALSFALPIVPCAKSPITANPVYKLGFCKLPNPFTNSLLGINQKFWLISTEPLAGLIIQFIIVFVLFILIFMLFKRKVAKILDLTRK